MFHRLRRAISVIVSDVVYFAPVDPPPVVDGLNIGEDAPADEADGRGRPAERKYAADLDSVGVTPGLSAANADDPSAIANAHAIFNAMNMRSPPICRHPQPQARGASFLLAAAATKDRSRSRGCISSPSIVRYNLQFFF